MKELDIKNKSKEISNDINQIMIKLNSIDELPCNPDPIKGVKHSSDFIFLQGLRHKLSMLKFTLQNYILYKNKNGWDIVFNDVEIERIMINQCE